MDDPDYNDFIGGDGSGIAVSSSGTGPISTSPASATKILTATTLSQVATLASTAASAASAKAVPSAGTFNYLGCSMDSSTSRTLSSLSWAGTGLSVERCASYCAAYKYMGVEFGSE